MKKTLGVILAGGKGSRAEALCDRENVVAKHLLPIPKEGGGEESLTMRAVRLFVQNGIERVLVVCPEEKKQFLI